MYRWLSIGLVFSSVNIASHALAFETINYNVVEKARLAVTAQETGTCVFSALDFDCWGQIPVSKPTLVNPTQFATNGKGGHCVLDEGKPKCWGAVMAPRTDKASFVTVGPGNVCTIEPKKAIKCSGGAIVDQDLSDSYLQSAEPYRSQEFAKLLFREPESMCVGFQHACGLEKGTVRCWGPKFKDILNGDFMKEHDWEDVLTPPYLFDVKQVACGDNYTCALYGEAGKVECWGFDGIHYTNYRDKHSNNRIYPPFDLEGVWQISVNQSHGCSVGKQGVRCWGRNDRRQASAPTDLVEAVQVSTSVDGSCATHQGGIRCWGNNQNGKRDVPEKFASLIFALGVQKLEQTLDSLSDSLVAFKGDILVQMAKVVRKYDVNTSVDAPLKDMNEKARYFALMRLEQLITYTDSDAVQNYLPTYKKLQTEATEALHIKSESDYGISQPIAELSLVMVKTAVMNSREFYFRDADQKMYENLVADIGTVEAETDYNSIAQELVSAINKNQSAVDHLIHQTSTKAVGMFINDIRDALSEKLGAK